jgi:hypothetical protein
MAGPIETLAFVTVVITQGVEGLPTGLALETDQPVQCVPVANEILQKVEAMGGQADIFCDYTAAPIKSLRPKARGQ